MVRVAGVGRVAVAITLGELRTRVTLENPTRTSDGQGGYTEEWTALDPPEAWVAIRGLTGAERLAHGTVVTQATHAITLRYHPGVTTETRLSWTDRANRARTLAVVDVTDLDERGVELQLTCAEVSSE